MTADWSDDADKPYVPQYQVATQKVLAYITENRLVPGDRLPTERQLAELLGMSHTVVREAVKVLSATGRVRVRKRAGLIVDEPNSEIVSPANSVFSPTQSDQVEQLFDYRRII